MLLLPDPARHLLAIAADAPARPEADAGVRGERCRASGFTLVELILALAVIGVLSALCIPAYADYTRRTYVSEGLILSAVAKARVVEEVMVNNGVTPTGPFFSLGPDGNAPVTPYELIEQNPSRMIRQIIRAGSVVVITYNRALDPDNRVEYSLVLKGRIPLGGGKMDFLCLSGRAAFSDLAAATASGAPVGEPLPPEWAPASCRS